VSDTHLDRLLDEIVTLPSAPTVLIKVTQMVDNPSISLGEVGEAIAADPPISMKILRLVNSAYYGVRHTVGSIEHAISLLGLKVVKNLVLTATIFHTFSSVRAEEGLLFEREQFWLHCVSTGIIAKTLAQSLPEGSPLDADELFAAGLLHDVGKIILQQHLHKKFEQALKKSATERTPLYECEVETLGVDHARVGGKLAEKWKLPGELVKAIQHHHPAPDQDNFPQAAAIVNLADFISYAKELGKGGPVGSVKFVTEAWEASALRKSDIPAIMDKLRDSAKMAGELLGMVR